jgi:hypothetical protein
MRHPMIQFLAALPQFDVVILDDAVVEMRSGAIVRMHPGHGESAHSDRLALVWPGQATDKVCHVDGKKYLEMALRVAVRLGADEEALRKRLAEV